MAEKYGPDLPDEPHDRPAAPRKEMNLQRREKFLADPRTQSIIQQAQDRVLGRTPIQNIEETEFGLDETKHDYGGIGRPAAPSPPVVRSTVPGEPTLRGRAAIRGGGGMPQRGAPDRMEPRAIAPQLRPGSPWKYEHGGQVTKYGSNTCVVCEDKFKRR